MGEVWSLPGYDVQALVGYGATGEVWSARELATGDLVALKRLRDGADPEVLRREAALLQGLDSPYVLRLRAVLGEGAGTVLVLDHAAGGSLAALLARRGALDPGEVVTVAAPLAQGLAAAHARGLVHGDVTPSNVLFTAEGMPLLADLGLARVVGERGPVEGTAEYVAPEVAAGGVPDQAADVWALGAVAHHALTGIPPHADREVAGVLASVRAGSRAPLGLLAPSAPRPLVAAVEAALSPDPAQRPTAAALASALRRAHAAAPVALHGPAATVAGPPVRPTHAVHPAHAAPPAPRRRVPARLLVAAAAVAALALAATAGWLSGRSGEAEPAAVAAAPAARPVPAAQAVAPDWPALLDALDAERAAAFAAADTDRLRAVHAPGSPGLAADTALVQELAAAGRTATGVRHEVRQVEQLSLDGDRARLRVVDVLAGYEVRDAAGAVVSTTPARGEQAYVVELLRTPDGWRLAETFLG